MDKIAMTVGYVTMAATGLGFAASLLWLAAYFLNKAGWRAWDRAKSLYKVVVMTYWFRKMGEDGTHAVRKDYEEKRAAQLTQKAEQGNL